MEPQIFQIESKQQKIDALTQEQEKEWKEKAETVNTIIFKGNSYSKVFFLSVQENFRASKNLQRLNGNDMFVGRGKDEIPESLGLLGNSLIGLNIVSLDLSNNAVNQYGAEALKPFLEQAHSLQRLFLNNCGLGIKGIEHISKGLAVGGVQLQILALGRNRGECDGAIELAKEISNLKELRELHIYQNSIKQKGMIPLLDSLQGCPKLELLDIRDNFIHEETTQSLARVIQGSAYLTQLNISDCNIQVHQNDIIIAAIASMKNIIKLGYSYAEISDAQGRALFEIINPHINEIRKLELKGNNFKSATKKLFREPFQNKQKVLGAFDSDEEDDEEDELVKLFSQFEI